MNSNSYLYHAERPGLKGVGFTLLELLIAVVVIVIISAIAVPGYNSSLRKARRADAQAELLRLQQAEERWRANNFSYAELATLGGASSVEAFTFAITDVSAVGYTLTATASGNQVRDTEAGVRCSVMTLNESGVGAPSGCWR